MRYRLNTTVEPFEYEGFEDGLELDEGEWNKEVPGRSSTRPEYIRWVQRSLNAILGLRLAEDGISGAQTRSAIRSFQQRKGLTADGIMGPQTEKALIAAGASAPVSDAPPGSPRPEWITWVPSPYHSSRYGNAITAIIYHFTAGPSLEGTVRWFQDNPKSVSAHYVAGKDGSIVQMVPLERAAHHAGASSLPGCRRGVNGCSIGIEIVNWGKLTKQGDNFYTHFGKPYKGSTPVYARGQYWEPYTDSQYRALIRLTQYLLTLNPGITHITGHEHIAPGRKNDPGGAFAWDTIRSGLGTVYAGHIGPLPSEGAAPISHEWLGEADAKDSEDSFELAEEDQEATIPLPKDKVVFGSITRELFVPFRKDFTKFHQEVRKAIGRYVTFRSDQGAILDHLLNSEPGFLPAIQATHSFGLTKPPKAEFTAISIFATFVYTPGFKRVTRITFGT